jgi:hypothetical protein
MRIGFLLLILIGSVIGCALDSSIPSSSSGTLDDYLPATMSLSASQNTMFTQEMNPDPSSFENLQFNLVTPPANGIVTSSGTEIVYKPNAFFSGTDRFTFTLNDGFGPSKEVEAVVEVEPLSSGVFNFTEDYQGGAYQLSGWRSYESTFGHRVPTASSFGSGTFNGDPVNHRDLNVTIINGDNSGSVLYNYYFGAEPVDGTGASMNNWAWMAELIQIPQCFYQVEVVAKFSWVSANPLISILLNYDIQENFGEGPSLTGYQLLVNSGGASVTLSRFDDADEHATSFMDRWPNTNIGSEAFANPVTEGPYRGWNYVRNTFPAGGRSGRGDTDVVLAARYEYDPVTDQTTISYELRNKDGSDDTPGSYDVVVNLSGSDSLAPGGGFGFMPVTYHHGGGTSFDSQVAISELQLNCTTP